MVHCPLLFPIIGIRIYHTFSKKIKYFFEVRAFPLVTEILVGDVIDIHWIGGSNKACVCEPRPLKSKGSSMTLKNYGCKIMEIGHMTHKCRYHTNYWPIRNNFISIASPVVDAYEEDDEDGYNYKKSGHLPGFFDKGTHPWENPWEYGNQGF
jgi:hypothetical protein